MTKGLTLVELLLTTSIFAIILGAAAPVTMSFYYRFQSVGAEHQITSTLRSAQTKSLGGENDTTHGVYFDSGAPAIVIFQGADYATRDSSYDLTIDFSGGTTLATDFGTEIVFDKITGDPSTTGSVTVASKNRSVVISINDEGLID